MDAFSCKSGDAAQRAIEGLYQEGFLLHTDERYAEAAAHFRAMLRAAPTDERGWLALGDCHEKLGQLRVALELYSAGTIAAEPAPRCLLSRFRVLYDMNRPTDAERAYDQALEIATWREDDALGSIIENERRIRP
jgi:tetratricopeptide (TPR) repeat protein